MTTTGLGRRVAALTAQLSPPDDYYARRLREMVAAADRARQDLLARVPRDLRTELAAAFADPDRRHDLTEWVGEPFARWATMPEGFEYPRELVSWLLHPPRDWFMGHACGRCGLNVPLLMTWTNDPDPPPKSIVVFPSCPACGERTSYAANSRPDGGA
jgi:hypothetical protein